MMAMDAENNAKARVAGKGQMPNQMNSSASAPGLASTNEQAAKQYRGLVGGARHRRRHGAWVRPRSLGGHGLGEGDTYTYTVYMYCYCIHVSLLMYNLTYLKDSISCGWKLWLLRHFAPIGR